MRPVALIFMQWPVGFAACARAEAHFPASAAPSETKKRAAAARTGGVARGEEMRSHFSKQAMAHQAELSDVAGSEVRRTCPHDLPWQIQERRGADGSE